MGADDSFTIDELAQAAGMTPRNVRAYRTKGLLPPPIRQGRSSSYRLAHLDRLRRIKELRDAGLPLKMIIDAARRGDDLSPRGPLSLLTTTFATPDGSPAVSQTARGTAPSDGTGAMEGTAHPLDAGPASSAVAQLLQELAGHGLHRTTGLAVLLHSARSARALASELADLLHADPISHPQHRGHVPPAVWAVAADLALLQTQETLAQTLLSS